MTFRVVLVRFGLPLLAAVAAAVMFAYFVAPGVDVDGMARSIVGPVTWPRTMLAGIVICAVALVIRNAIVQLVESRRNRADVGPPPKPAALYDDRVAWSYIAALVCYGAAIPTIGFALGTLAYIASCLLIGGIRKPLTIGLVSTVGTVALLYMFAKVAYMPLDRGMGAFDGITVSIYRLLGIF